MLNLTSAGLSAFAMWRVGGQLPRTLQLITEIEGASGTMPFVLCLVALTAIAAPTSLTSLAELAKKLRG